MIQNSKNEQNTNGKVIFYHISSISLNLYMFFLIVLSLSENSALREIAPHSVWDFFICQGTTKEKNQKETKETWTAVQMVPFLQIENCIQYPNIAKTME